MMMLWARFARVCEAASEFRFHSKRDFFLRFFLCKSIFQMCYDCLIRNLYYQACRGSTQPRGIDKHSCVLKIGMVYKYKFWLHLDMEMGGMVGRNRVVARIEKQKGQTWHLPVRLVICITSNVSFKAIYCANSLAWTFYASVGAFWLLFNTRVVKKLHKGIENS